VNVAEVRGLADKIRAELAKAVVGQADTVDLMLIALFAGGHILLEGPPGTAKTFLAQCFAKAVNLGYGRIQFTPDLMPGDILGANLFDFQTSTFKLVKGPIFCELLLADEINRTPPKTQAALLEAMQERTITIDGAAHPLGDRFTVVATQNPLEQQGTYPLPEAQLDRFLFKHDLGYPSAEEERAIVASHGARVGQTTPDRFGVAAAADAATIGAPDRRDHRICGRPGAQDPGDRRLLQRRLATQRGHAGHSGARPRRPGRPRLRHPRRCEGPGAAGPAPSGDPVAGGGDRRPQGR